MLKNNILEDVVIEILSQLPVKTLVRFKLVHKSWYALIESSQFVAMQLRNHVRSPSSNNDSSLYLLVKSWNLTSTGAEGNVLSLLTYDDRRQATSNGDDVSFAVKNVDLPFRNEYGFWISSQCDGIFCLYGDTHARDHTIILANPEIREFKALPNSCIPIPTEDYNDLPEPCYSEPVGVGFGFDRKTNDYKAVRILQFNTFYHSLIGDPQAEVYSLRSNSWRQIKYFNHGTWLSFYSGTHSLSSYWNGVYYWPARHSRGPYDLVYGMASFNFSDEAFQFIAFPEHVSLTLNHHDYGMIEYHETLALISYPMNNYFDIWLRDEFGITETWTKLLSIGPLLGLERPLVFWKSNEILLLLSGGQVASYNVVTNQMKNLPICGGKYLNVEIVIYKSSLVSIN